MKVKNGSCFAVFLCFFIVSVTKEGKSNSVGTERRLNNVGNVLFICFLIKVVKAFAAVVSVLSKVVVGTVRNAPKLTPTERELEFEVGSSLRIEGKFLGIVVTKS